MTDPIGPVRAAVSGRYEIEREIGQGAFATVYLARDLRHDRLVAFKVLNADPTSENSELRFLREIRLLAKLQHPNILPLIDSGHAEAMLYYVMPYVKGESLRDRIHRERQLAVESAIAITREAADALACAHEQGIIHRDIKPENILLSAGHSMIADFGVARAIDVAGVRQLTRTGLGGPGTPAYMSPEQMLGDGQIDQRSDIYSLGCVLYEMLTGKPPFHGEGGFVKRFTEPPPLPSTLRLDLPETLERIITKALARDPGDRYPTAAEFGKALAAPAQFAAALVSARAVQPIPDHSRLASVAVLPFIFLTDVDNSRALSLGFADALITIFGNLEDVIVAPTSAILNYAAGAEPAQVCRDLRVRHALQGTVQKLGSHWRVSIQLFDATTHKITLSEKHDFMLDNMFEVQDEIGRRVVESLQTRFPLAVPRSRDRYSSDPEAYSEFMAGLRESSSDQQDTLRSAAEHLSRAVERDPDFALAHATLSFVSMNMHFQFDPQHTWLQRAEEHCRRALALDSALPEAHLARAWILWSPAKNFQHAEAIAALEQVLVARPNFERAHNRMATICQHIGRLQEARSAHEQAQRANPKTRTGNLEYFYIYSGDFERAEEAAEAWLRERPGNMYALGTCILLLLLNGDLELAEQQLAAGLKQLPDEPWLLTLQGMLYARRRKTDLALECVRRALDYPRSFGHTHHTYYNIACVYAVLGETDKAMGWLERTVDSGFACWPFFHVDPHLESLREEPTFKRLVAELELTYTALEIKRL
ncbi:MAG: protein kinase [Gemmatimonadota bacterium]|nr:protein kinase [Gemmatimonadota bacterium]